jgi:hypothetical protein
MTALLPCPCCGSKNVFQWINYQDAKCRDCEMRGPVKAWNSRVPPALAELSALTVDQLVMRAEDCYAEITRRSLAAINGPPG